MKVVGGFGFFGRHVVGLNGRYGVRPAEFASSGSFSSPLLDDVDPGDDNTEFLWVIRSPLPSSGVLTADDDGGMSHTGAADGSYTTSYDLYTWPPGGPAVYEGIGSFTTNFGAVTLLASPAAGATATAALTTAIRLASALSALASATAALTTSSTFAVAAAAQASATSNLTTSSTFAASAVAQAAATAALRVGVRFVTAPAATAASSAALTTSIRLAATPQALATGTAALTTVPSGYAVDATARAASTAQLTTSIRVASSAQAAASASAALLTGVRLSAAPQTQAAATAALSSAAQQFVSGFVAQAASTAALTTAVRLAVTAIARASASAAMELPTNVSAGAVAQPQATADLTIFTAPFGNAVFTVPVDFEDRVIFIESESRGVGVGR